MTEAYLSLGSNMGDKVAQIGRALDLLAARGVAVQARSRCYRTPPWGPVAQDWFANACARVETALSPSDLLALCLSVERAMGRERLERWGPRLIDIDLLAYGDVTCRTPDLELPHPRMLERAFVLVPLSDIAPGLVVGGIPIHDALAGLDRTGISEISPTV